MVAAQNAGHLLVEVGDAVFDVDQEENEVGLFGGKRHLFAYFAFEDVVGVNHPAAGVDDGELLLAPFALAVLTVARGAGLVADDGLAGARQTVEKGRFADVGPAYYRY